MGGHALWLLFKAAGAIVVMTACAGWAWERVRQLEARPRALAAIISALQMLETEIAYALTPLPDALAAIAERQGLPVGAFLATAARLMLPCEHGTTAPGSTAQEAWRQALEQAAPRLCLRESDVEPLSRLGAVLGVSDREDQIKHLRLAREQLAFGLKQAVEERDTKTRLYLYLGLCAGLTVIIALW